MKNEMIFTEEGFLEAVKNIEVGWYVDVDVARTGHEDCKTEEAIVLEKREHDNGITKSIYYNVRMKKSQKFRDVYLYEILAFHKTEYVKSE